jgi:hypothetical protein
MADLNNSNNTRIISKVSLPSYTWTQVLHLLRIDAGELRRPNAANIDLPYYLQLSLDCGLLVDE